MILVTGGAGFIGSEFVLQWIHEEKSRVITLDKLTYAGNLLNLASLAENPLHTFIHADIADRRTVSSLLKQHQPDSVVHCAAESHVDRSITSPEAFITTNIVGTSILLEEVLLYWQSLSPEKQKKFRFLYISTDEVYGSLEPKEKPAAENHCYAPNSPYAASKASSDHLVRAYNRTYNLPTITTHSSNNFGPRQFPEKLIPLALFNALREQPIPLYGDGLNIRDWIYVEDHCKALRFILKKGVPGESYNIGANNEKTNLELIHEICKILDSIKPRKSNAPYSDLIQTVKDRLGHDRRYALDTTKIQNELGWHLETNFAANLYNTINWYLENPEWMKAMTGRE
jgi:dTDP-glucose 4,6-dehydratase